MHTPAKRSLVSNTTHDKRRLCPRQVSQRFVIRTFRHISHLMLTFNGFNAIVYGNHKEQVPSRTFREHSQLLTNRVKFYGPGKDTSIYTEGKYMGVINGRFPTLDLEHIRHQQCPVCHKYAILLVDVQTETVPRTDLLQGNKQYHCLECQRTFVVDKNGAII